MKIGLGTLAIVGGGAAAVVWTMKRSGDTAKIAIAEGAIDAALKATPVDCVGIKKNVSIIMAAGGDLPKATVDAIEKACPEAIAPNVNPPPAGSPPPANPPEPAHTSPQADAVAAIRKALTSGLGCSPDIYPLVAAAGAAGVQVLPADITAALDKQCPTMYADLEQHLTDLLGDPTVGCKDLTAAADMIQLVGATVGDLAWKVIDQICNPGPDKGGQIGYRGGQLALGTGKWQG